MPRSSWFLLLLAGVALSATGCAHCDTCDELPLPCPSGDCGMGLGPAPIMEEPLVMAPAMVSMPTSPVVIRSQPAASGSGTAANRSGQSGSSSVPAPLPPGPGAQTPPFSTTPSTAQ